MSVSGGLGNVAVRVLEFGSEREGCFKFAMLARSGIFSFVATITLSTVASTVGYSTNCLDVPPSDYRSLEVTPVFSEQIEQVPLGQPPICIFRLYPPSRLRVGVYIG